METITICDIEKGALSAYDASFTVVTEQIESRASYGVTAVYVYSVGRMTQTIHDIDTDCAALADFVALLNQTMPSQRHFAEAVDDYVTARSL